MRTPIHLTGDPDADAESWGKRLAGPAVDAAPAAKALAGLGTMRSLEVLLEGTSLPDGMSRGIAATAVGSHPLASAARERLEELLRDPSEYVASAARGALERIGGAEPRVPPARSIEDVLGEIADAAARVELVVAEARHVFEARPCGVRWTGPGLSRRRRWVRPEVSSLKRAAAARRDGSCPDGSPGSSAGSALR